jgi:hypothetical protein
MPWSGDRYPPAMAGLPPAVRAKAIEIANALLESGRGECAAIRIAIAKARQWATRPRMAGNRRPRDGERGPSPRMARSADSDRRHR